VANEQTHESPWAATVVLASGDTAFVRPMTADDRDGLAAFHRRQSAESIYKRFFSPKPELTDKELAHFTNIDMIDRAALVVESHDEFTAWASYERWPGRNEAEAAFMVDDDHHGQGIATLLLEHLAAIARANGIEHFTAEVLADNRAMLAVFAKAGWPLQRRFESGIVDLDWDLATTDEFLDTVERREQRADSRAIARILLPRAIAVVGASDRPGSIGAELWRNVVNSVDVPVYPVNPGRDRLDDRICLHSIKELPDEVSLAIIAVPAHALDETIDACISKRMRGAVIVTRLDGSELVVDIEAIVTRSRRHGLRVIGPSSMGVASPWPETLLQAALVNVALPPGNVAISMQSGTLGGSVLRQASDLQLGLSWFVSLGDKSDVSANDLLQFWEDDERTTVVAMYTESFGNPRKFARIARRVSRQMPIVAVRTGAAASGVMGGALYQQAGLIEVPTVNALLDTTRVLATQPVLRGPRVAVVTNSRSPGVLASAALDAAGLEAVDVHLDWRAGDGEFRRAIAATLSSDSTDGVLVIHAPAVLADVDSQVEEIVAAAEGADKPVVAVILGGRDGPIRPGSGVPAFTFPEQAAAVLGRSYSYGCWLASEAAGGAVSFHPVDPRLANRLIDKALGEHGPSLVASLEAERALLAAYAIEMAPAVEATPATAVEAANDIGYPVAITAARRRVGHSVRAGIALDVTSDDEVEDTVAIMSESLGGDGQHLVVQEMTAPGLDIRVRCELDDRLGVIVSVGLGGVRADVIDDRTNRLAPVSPATARTMLLETHVAAAISEANLDDSPLVDLIAQAAQLASDHPEIVELDLNPILLSDRSAVVTDAVVRLQRPALADGPIRRL
jgi:acyl-CoA synthetase (NDP forming)/GNAT superfamily N-acetyltransferase